MALDKKEVQNDPVSYERQYPVPSDADLAVRLRMDQETLAIIGVVVLAASSGAYLTALVSRRSRHRVGWHRAIVGMLGSGIVVSLFVWFGLSLTHGTLTKGPPDWALALWAFMWACGFAFVPAVLVVWYYRRRSKNVDAV